MFLTACRTKNQEEEETKQTEEALAIANSAMEGGDDDHDAFRKKKYYKYPEDELLDEMDQHERDMNDMLKYLTEVEDLMKGQDLKAVSEMMEVTKEGMS